MEWYWKLAYLFSGAFIGALGVALCAMARCGECEIIERIRRAGK